MKLAESAVESSTDPDKKEEYSTSLFIESTSLFPASL